jgi:hypothetical protein
VLALTTARSRGFDVNNEELERQLQFVANFMSKNRENYLQGKGTGGAVDTAGYALLTLDVGGWKADDTTAAAAEYVLLHQKESDHWATRANRPPSELSPFTTTYLALRALHKYGTPAQKDRIGQRNQQARQWLLKASTRDTEDRVFRLWGLQSAGADEKDIRSAAEELIRTQRPDGGWSQLETMESDAYATGTALVVLHQAGGLPVSDAVYQRGVKFLLQSQREDGSWYVKSRSRPFQTYYESGFPHGKDQFISIAASSWAATALALACPPKP